MPTVIEQLKELKKISPRPEWMEMQRDLLLSQITRQTSPQETSKMLNYWLLFKSILPTGLVRFVARPVGVVTALLVLVFTSGIFSVSASRGSLPGDFLYPVKLTSEQFKVGLATSSQDKAKVHVEIAEERVREIQQLAQNEQGNKKSEKIKIAADGLKNEMEKVKHELDIAKGSASTGNQIVTIAKEVNEKTSTITDKVKEVQNKQAVITGEQTGKSGNPSKEIIKTLNEATVAADAAGVKAVEVMVEKHQLGGSPLTDKEVLDVVQKKILKTETQVKEVSAKVTQVGQQVVKENKENEANNTNTAKDNPTNSVVPEKTVADVKNDDNQKVMVEIQDKPVEAEKILTEARNLLNQGDLGSAVEKMKQTVEIVTEVNTKVETLQLGVQSTITNPTETIPPPAPAVPPVPTTTPVVPTTTTIVPKT